MAGLPSRLSVRLLKQSSPTGGNFFATVENFDDKIGNFVLIVKNLLAFLLLQYHDIIIITNFRHYQVICCCLIRRIYNKYKSNEVFLMSYSYGESETSRLSRLSREHKFFSDHEIAF